VGILVRPAAFTGGAECAGRCRIMVPVFSEPYSRSRETVASVSLLENFLLRGTQIRAFFSGPGPAHTLETWLGFVPGSLFNQNIVFRPPPQPANSRILVFGLALRPGRYDGPGAAETRFRGVNA